MPIVYDVRYETALRRLDDISPDSVVEMLRDVRECVGNFSPGFEGLSLLEVLEIVEEGEFLSEEEESTMCKVDLSAARGIVRAYQINSEPGCQSCTELSRETLDAQDASTGRYCGDSDPDFVDGHVRYSGNSPKVKEHYNFPCSVWKPRFSQTLGELLKDES